MNPVEQQRQPSAFTFYDNQQRAQNLQQRGKNQQQKLIDDNFLFTIGSFIDDLQKQEQSLQEMKQRKKYKKIKGQELQKVFKFFRKYQPLYFNKMEIKEMSYKFKKGVSIKNYKQGYYFGEISQISTFGNKKTIKQGKGILVYNLQSKKDQNLKLKRVYEGQWQSDKKQGVGFQRFSDGSVYHGYYHQNKPEGKGKFTSSQGQIYEGEWKNGMKNGQGYSKGVKGQTYIGQWLNGIPQGYGIFVSSQGDRYEGQFKNSLKHGQGIQKFINGDIYKGFYQNGKPCGFGDYYWNNKSYFKGYFKNGLRSGQGQWKRGAGNCDKYEGQYQSDKKWGYGIFTWANGNIYKGNYSGDLRNEYGQMHWVDGSYYKGYWKDGVQNGKGQLFIVGEGLRIGIFQNNEIVEIQYQEPFEDQQNQENKNKKLNNKQSKTKNLIRNRSVTSNVSMKSKNSKFNRMQTITSQQKQIQPIHNQMRPALNNQNHKNYRRVALGSNQNGMKSVPLKQLFENTENSRSLIKRDKEMGFRITKKVSETAKINQSFNQSRISMSSSKKNRILHSSFYLHRFINIGKPKHANVEEKNFFNQTQDNS